MLEGTVSFSFVSNRQPTKEPSKVLQLPGFSCSVCTKSFHLPKGDELPIMVSETGGSGPARVWGHVKSTYSAEEILKGLRV